MKSLITCSAIFAFVFFLACIHPSLLAGEPGPARHRQDTENESATEQEYYELRTYRINDYDKQQIAEKYLESALLPALNRLGINRVGVFTNQDDENDHSIFVLIPFSKIDQFVSLNSQLAADKEYQSQAAEYFKRELKDPIYERVESRFMKAFAGMPQMEIPAVSRDRQKRVFELRLYESHTEDHARRKVQMFNDGEIQVMRDTELGPVFFGETLIGPRVPNLIYMLSSPDRESHQEHWKGFLAHPEWIRMKGLKQYKDTVSKIQKWFLEPTPYSQF